MHLFQSELYTNVKMCYSRHWFENVQMHLCTFTMAHRELFDRLHRAAVRVLIRVQKTQFFKKKAQPSGFFGFYWVYWVLLGFFGQAGKIGKIIQKLSNLKP